MSAHRWRGTRYAMAMVVAVVAALIAGGARTRTRPFASTTPRPAMIGEGMPGSAVPAPTVETVFISVDPDRDTNAVIKEYVAAFDPRVIGLRGDDATLEQIAPALDLT